MAAGEGWCGVGGVGSTTREGRVSGRKSETGGRTTAQVKHLFSTPANSSVRDRVKPVATAYHPIETDRIRTSEDLYHLSTYPPTRFTHLRPPTTSPGGRVPVQVGQKGEKDVRRAAFFPLLLSPFLEAQGRREKGTECLVWWSLPSFYLSSVE